MEGVGDEVCERRGRRLEDNGGGWSGQCDEVCERQGRRVGGQRGLLVGTVEKVVDTVGTHLRSLFGTGSLGV